jgi:hypothetical protein
MSAGTAPPDFELAAYRDELLSQTRWKSVTFINADSRPEWNFHLEGYSGEHRFFYGFWPFITDPGELRKRFQAVMAA